MNLPGHYGVERIAFALMNIAFNLQFLLQISETNMVVMGDDNPREIEGALRAVFALWWDPVKHKKDQKCTLI